jgi:hypothetical protein
LAFLDLVDYLHSADGDDGILEALESQHRPHSLCDFAVVLFHQVVQVLICPHRETWQQDALVL